DGLASLIGQHLPASRPGIRAFFRRTFSTPAGNKTLGGTSALFFSAVAIVILVLRIDTQMAWQHILLSAMLVAGTVTAAELGTPRGFDNITVALFSTATTWWLMLRFNPNMPDAASSADLPAGILAFIFVGAVAFAFLLWRIRATTRRGALISGFFTIVTAMSAGWPVSLVVVACQVADGLIAHRRRASTRAAIATGIPAVLALWYSASGNIILLWAIAAAVCASATDSIAGSLGKKFGGTVYQLPFFRPVPAGRGGGVSLAGTLFAIVTAAIGGLLAHFLVPQTSWQVAGIIAGSALFGSLLDSFLGATIQAEYRDLHTGELTSTPGSHNPLVRGIHHIRPDVIDFLSSTGAVAFCFLLCWFFVQSPSLLH
ncbi:MAG: DUF92 domain-containing protein, partial [Spirochaetaceae bacterium]